MRRRVLVVILTAVLALVSLGAASDGVPPAEGGLPGYSAADPGAPAVTPDNLLESERFWPYQVALTAAWRPLDSQKPLAAGMQGVLIRVEDSGMARVDFGRHGQHRVPVSRTDLVENANRIRRGELHKMGPNFALAIGSKLVDPRPERIAPLGFVAAAGEATFLCVFADPNAEGFEDLARALAPLQERRGVLTVLFAQGQHPDAELRERLRALDWKVPYAYDFLAEGYTRSLLPEGTPVPAVLLQTREGRLLFQSPWGSSVPAELDAALDAVKAS
jgi:hypothetical protein